MQECAWRCIARAQDAHIYFHCSVGIHQTGFFALILLKLMGHDKTAALDEQARLRQVTSEQVGEEGTDLAEFAAAMLETGDV